MATGKRKNVILISVDEIRPDHLSCYYGYETIKTNNIDKIAKEGVLFETCISAACLTAVCMSSVLCANYPNKHTVRGPFSHIQSKTIAEILKECGYKTAGFVGNGLLGARHGFAAGFGYYDEPKEDTSWGSWHPEGKEVFYEGNWWIDRMLDWLRKNRSSTFFIWGHYFETHEGAEHVLLRKGVLKEGVLSDFSYKDAKIKYMDGELVGRLLKTFDELNLWEDTILVVMGDHGTNLGEHPARPVPHRPYKLTYPQHTSLYDVDLKVFLIIMDKNLPEGRRVEGMVRSVDVVPTLLDLVGVSMDELDFDGTTLVPIIAKGKAQGLSAYAEMLYPLVEGIGALQAFRTDRFKFIRDLTKGMEEFYSLQDDPLEQNNLIKEVGESRRLELEDIRKQLNARLFEVGGEGAVFSGKEHQEIEERLRRLGYAE